MRKLFLFSLFAFVFASAEAAVVTEEKIAAYNDQIAKATAPAAKADLQASIDVLGGADPVTFEEIVARCKAAFAKHNYTNDAYARTKACQIACWMYSGKFAVEAFKVARADNNVFVYYLARTHRKLLGLSDAEVFDIYVDRLSTGNINAAGAKDTVGELLKLAPSMDETKVKAVLKKLNRLYSPFLIKDKAAWEPVVAMIRTAMETW